MIDGCQGMTYDRAMRFADLAVFIDKERVAIVAEWETFAGSLAGAATMNPTALRDHADEILTAIVEDMKSLQTSEEQAKKSKGRGDAQRLRSIGKIHAGVRIEGGFTLPQMVAEYRALRASVLRLWQGAGRDSSGVTRFNESIDEALTQAVDSFTETTDHYRDQTLGILGHDLRNPLAAIITGSAMLAGTDSLDDRSVRVAARMLSSANRMNRMIGDLLDLTRTRLGDRIPVVRASLDLAPVCQQVIAELEGAHPGSGLSFATHGALRGDWDGDRIAQVISNLVRNAIQHGSAHEPITIVARGGKTHIVLEVHNAGAVIPKKRLAQIFEPMVRHVVDEKTNPGLGLGLYIAYQIVIAHGGTLEATSTETAGTTLRMCLPRHSPPAAASARGKTRKQTPKKTAKKGRITTNATGRRAARSRPK